MVKVVDDQAPSAGFPEVEPGPFKADSADIKVLTEVVESVLGSLGKQTLEAR